MKNNQLLQKIGYPNWLKSGDTTWYDAMKETGFPENYIKKRYNEIYSK